MTEAKTTVKKAIYTVKTINDFLIIYRPRHHSCCLVFVDNGNGTNKKILRECYAKAQAARCHVATYIFPTKITFDTFM